YIFPTHKDTSFHVNINSAKLRKGGLPKIGGIILALTDDLENGIAEHLIHESIHEAFATSGYKKAYGFRIMGKYAVSEGSTNRINIKRERSTLLEAPTQTLTPRIMEDYDNGLQALGEESIGARFMKLRDWMDVTKYGPGNEPDFPGYYPAVLLFDRALEDYSLKEISSDDVNLLKEYNIPGIIKNFRTFKENYLRNKPDTLMDIQVLYDTIKGELDDFVKSSSDVNNFNQEWGQMIRNKAKTGKSTVSNLEPKKTPSKSIENAKNYLGVIESDIENNPYLFSESLKTKFNDLNKQLRAFINKYESSGFKEGDLNQVSLLKTKTNTLLNELATAQFRNYYKDLSMLAKEGVIEHKINLERGLKGRIINKINNVKKKAKKMREITRSDPETTRIIETLDRAENSPFHGKLGELTGKRSYWKRAKDLAMESVRDMDWGSLSWFVGAAVAESLAEAFREFGKTYDLVWTGWVANGLRMEAFYDFLYIWGSVLAPKILWGAALIMNSMIWAGIKTIGGAVAYAVGGLLLMGLLIGVLTYVLVPLIHIIGVQFVRKTPLITFESNYLKKSSEENFYLANIEEMENYPLGSRIYVKLISKNKIGGGIMHTSCRIIKSSEGNVCKGKFFVDWRKDFYEVIGLYSVTRVPEWFSKVKNKIGEREIEIVPKIDTKFPSLLAFRDGEMCVKLGFYRKKCVKIDENLKDKLFYLPVYQGQTIKLWVVDSAVKCARFDGNGDKIEDCKTISPKQELSGGKVIRGKTKNKEISVVEGEKGLHGKLEVETENDEFSSKQFTWKDEEMLYEEDLIKK
ncbi:MAG: hypothetical protein ABEK17_00795, partial [Candidatus Aenigmatarchaeota archaeon]